MTARALSIVVLLCTVFASHSYGMDDGTEKYIHFPRSFEQGTLRYSLGVSWTLLPRAIVEEEIRQIPMVNAALRYELPSHFSVTAQLSTVYITNVLSAGVFWSHTLGGVSLAVSD